ncbi:hypothetical protein P691DRAFT_715172 [Macrolepiota fuliginosa MF-IS2]|uniref:DUF4219 domain-containing protein n=1 Tax=Macrolepiota fuliginosa MF-IS2 TaxID=1400762 RepID=A0A9P6BXF8_9AGAR|nr:hypothetical protein P691DRAFT_715172 [Macrolepiota fuliginosa MF-IS2]
MGPGSDSANVWAFPKLNSSNYCSWSRHMQAALDSCQLWWGFIDVSEEPAPLKLSPNLPIRPGDTYTQAYSDWEKSQAEYKSWVWKDRSVMGILKGAIKEAQWPYIEEAKTLYEIWKALYDLYFMSQ